MKLKKKKENKFKPFTVPLLSRHPCLNVFFYASELAVAFHSINLTIKINLQRKYYLSHTFTIITQAF